MRSRRSKMSAWSLLGLLALLLSVLASCGATAPTITPQAGGRATAPAQSAGPVRAVPVGRFALSGQERVGAPGQGAFLFFDADG